MFELEGRKKMIFQGGGHWYNKRSLIFKQKISDKVLEVFVLFYLCCSVLFYRKIKYEGDDWVGFSFICLFIWSRIWNSSLIKSG
jgi:hypothetical protein